MNKTSHSLTSKFVMLPSPIKSARDKKEYKVIKLDNGLKVLLISDSSSDLQKLDQDEDLQIQRKLRHSDNHSDRLQFNDDFRKRFQRAISIDENATATNSQIKGPRKSLQRFISMQETGTISEAPNKSSNGGVGGYTGRQDQRDGEAGGRLFSDD